MFQSFFQFSSATTKLGSNRRAYSSSTAVNDDGGQKDFPEVRSSSHPVCQIINNRNLDLVSLVEISFVLRDPYDLRRSQITFLVHAKIHILISSCTLVTVTNFGLGLDT